MQYLTHNDAPAVLDVYTPCQAEHGIADAAASQHARMAVESRMSPVFVHDPRRGPSSHSRFSLDGNPDIDKDWATTTLEYVEDGATKLMDVPFTPADFARTRPASRSSSASSPRAADGGAGRRVHRPPRGRARRQDALRLGHRRREEAGQARSLPDPGPSGPGAPQVLAHPAVSRRARRRAAGREPPHRTRGPAGAVQEAVAEREILARLHRPGDVRAGGVLQRAAERLRRLADARLGGGAAPPAAAAPAAPAARRGASGQRRRGGSAKCNNCKTCYQDLPELFEKTKIIVDGETREVGHLIPGAVETA